MESCDVLIVGGGPGGSSCAYGLRDSGLDVLVLDRKTFPRDKTCAGWITPQVLEELAVDPELYAKERVLQPIRGFRVRRMGDPEALACFDRTVSYGIRRCEFDQFLLERCEARLRLGEPVKRIERKQDHWIVNGAIETPLLVGAGGHFCPVARLLSEAGGAAEPIVAAQELEFELDEADRADCPVDAEIPELFFTADLKGYGWVFRKGAFLNVGLGRQDRHALSEHVRAFLDFLRAQGKLPRRIPSALNGHAYLLYGQAPRRVVDDGVLLIGDSAGLAYPRSGEGIRPAVESGLLAAGCIARAGGRFGRMSLDAYRRALEGRFGRRQPRIALGPTDLLPAPLARWLAGKLLATPWFARHVVVERWFVHAHQAPLVASA
jgi:geranylgeranyl reductase family protein